MSYKITFLGTGTSSGVPMIGCHCRTCDSRDERDKRLRASVLIDTPTQRLLIDAGPDFRQQMLVHRISALDAILITHEHKDHVGGLDDVRALNFLSHKSIDVYAEPRVQHAIRKDYEYAFVPQNKKYPGVPEITLHTIEEDAQPFFIGQDKIIPVRAMHQKLPIFGFRIGPIGYLTDVKSIHPRELEKFYGVKLFVVSTVQYHPHRSHFSLEEAVHAAQMVGARQSFLTHLSHGLAPHALLATQLPEGIAPAYDNLEVEL